MVECMGGEGVRVVVTAMTVLMPVCFGRFGPVVIATDDQAVAGAMQRNPHIQSGEDAVPTIGFHQRRSQLPR